MRKGIKLKLSIVAPNGHGSSATVMIDGEVAKNVERITLDLEAGRLTRATIGYVAFALGVDVYVDDAEVSS